MKRITVADGSVFGPYESVSITPSGYVVDGGAVLPFAVVGMGTVDDWTGPLPTPALPPPVIPTVVTMKQAQLALLGAGKLDAVETAVASSPRAVQITWAKAGTVERGNPLVESFKAALGMTEADLDQLFLAASKL